MKKSLLLVAGLSVGFGLSAQSQNHPRTLVSKADLTGAKLGHIEPNQNFSFFAVANANNQRHGNPSAPLAQGTKFSSSYNAFTLLVSESHCLTANNALGVVLFTHRLSNQWAADPNANSGYVEYSWTRDNGATWDSTFYADDALGSRLFRYPSGAIINPVGNTDTAQAMIVSSGPYTDGSAWNGRFENYTPLSAGNNGNTTIYNDSYHDFPRISITSYDDSSAWVAGQLMTNPNSTTSDYGFQGGFLTKFKMNSSGNIVVSYDSIKPTFHMKSTGVPDVTPFDTPSLAFSKDGQTGYCTFIGVDNASFNNGPGFQSYVPIVYKTTDGGTTWNELPAFDFSSIPMLSSHVPTDEQGNHRPWFDIGNGISTVVDSLGQLHVVCAVSGGFTTSPDSLDYYSYWTSQSGGHAMAYIFDVHTMQGGNNWDAWEIDSLMTEPSTNSGPYFSSSSGNAIFACDARIQVSMNDNHSKLFYTWVDSDPNIATDGSYAENYAPDLWAAGIDLHTMMMAPPVQFTSSGDFYWDYVSNVALQTSACSYTIPATNSMEQTSGNYDCDAGFNHFYFNGATFSCSDFNTPINTGIDNHTAAVSAFQVYPNPASSHVNVSIQLTKSANVTFTLYNTLGQSVLSQKQSLTPGENRVELNTSDLSSGIYFLNMTEGTNKYTQKVVIQ